MTPQKLIEATKRAQADYPAEDASLLCSLLEKEYGVIERNFALNVQAENRITQGAIHTQDWAALGYTLHTLYVSFENYFL